MRFEKQSLLDANILLRAVWGSRVRYLIDTYEERVEFVTPALCFEEARRYIPVIAARRHADPTSAFEILARLEQMITIVPQRDYEQYETQARARIERRDLNDWPILATALLLDCPLWTEDRDFFGTGIATWTTDNIEIYLKGSES
jgi:predicted nucleic acid-binding protein